MSTKKKWQVWVAYDQPMSVRVEVEAETEDEAGALAIEAAQDQEFEPDDIRVRLSDYYVACAEEME